MTMTLTEMIKELKATDTLDLLTTLEDLVEEYQEQQKLAEVN
jgi:hypothetical protein